LNYVEFIEAESEFVLRFKLKGSICSDLANVLVGCVYVLPENTKYASDDAFPEIESEMFIFF